MFDFLNNYNSQSNIIFVVVFIVVFVVVFLVGKQLNPFWVQLELTTPILVEVLKNF